MTRYDYTLLVFTIAGGLALFLLGMRIMSEGLRRAVGARLQKLLATTTRNRLGGFVLGSALGATIHSSATVVMLVGFVNAGLLTLTGSVAPVLGANLGTTLSMQAVAFRVSDFAFPAIVLGLLASMALPHPQWKSFGTALVGFGLLFLGIETMSAAIQPHREVLAIYMTGIDGTSWRGMFAGIAVSTLLTAIWQSSGATIAIIFAFIRAGAFTSLGQIYPIVLGAHLGTCATGLLGSLGTNVEARRCALVHLLFNLFNVLLAIVARPLFLLAIPLTSTGLARQTANLHTAVMLVAGLVLLPFSRHVARVAGRLFMPSLPAPEGSRLDYSLLEKPEQATVAIIAELRRVTLVCSRSLALVPRILLQKRCRRAMVTIVQNEDVINQIKQAVREYSKSMITRYLSRRQIVLLSHLNRCMADIERIGDHIDQLCRASVEHGSVSSLDKESLDILFVLYARSGKMIRAVVASLDPGLTDFQDRAGHLLQARDDYIQSSIEANRIFMRKVEAHQLSPSAAFYLKEYIGIMDRMNRHIKNIAMAQKHDDFWIKRSKLNRKTPAKAEKRVFEVNIDRYLEQMQDMDN